MDFLNKYNKDIQFHPTQIAVIAGAIRARESGCNLLVFGVGNDTPLWRDINRNGHSLFLEDDAEWLRIVTERTPDFTAKLVSYDGADVASALRDPLRVIQSAQPPKFLLDRPWDVILIDGPRGYGPKNPGRSLPICWAAKIRNPTTDIFVDDANRELERRYADFLLLPKSSNSITIKRPGRDSALLWVMGKYTAP